MKSNSREVDSGYHLGFSTTQKMSEKICKTCKHENMDMQCDHPSVNEKGFADVEMKKCWEFNGRKSIGQKAYSKSGRK